MSNEHLPIVTDHARLNNHGNAITQTKDLLKSLSFLSFMLLVIPFALLAGVLKWAPPLTFILNFIAIVPLAKLLGTATEEIALRTNQTIGGLLNAVRENLAFKGRRLVMLLKWFYR